MITIALFGWGRHTDRLTVDSSPLTFGEIEEEVRNYWKFSEGFGPEEAYSPELEWLVLPAGWKFDGSTLGKWYLIGEGRRIGNQVLYKLEPKAGKKEKAAPKGGSP